MRFYCTISNTGYGELIDIDNEDNLNISLRFSNNTIRTFSFDRAYGRSIFDDKELRLSDKTTIIYKLEEELSSGKYDEKIKERLNSKIVLNGNLLHSILSEKYKFDGFMHETTINNLISILNDGKLKPREDLNKFDDSANNDIINQTSENVKKCVRFYFYYGTPTNYRFDQKNPDNMVYISLNWNLIYSKGCILVNGNASSKYSNSISAREYLMHYKKEDEFMDWKSIFHRESLPTIEECYCSTNGFEEKNAIIRKRNAEINIPNFVSTNYIDKIIFKSEEAYKRFLKSLNNDIIKTKFDDKIVIDEKYFY